MIVNNYNPNRNLACISLKKKRFTLSGKKMIAAIFFVLVVLISFQLIFSNYLSTEGQEVWETDKKAKIFEEENFALGTQIAQVSSLKSLSKRAKNAGFSKTGNFVYIQDHSSLAFKQ